MRRFQCRSPGALNCVSVVNGDEKYVILYDDESRVAALRQLGKWAMNPKLSFTGYQASNACQKIREITPCAD